MKNLKVILAITVVLSLFSCSKNQDPTDIAVKSMSQLKIPDNFEYKATLDISLSIEVRNSASILRMVPVKVYLDNPGYDDNPNPNARLIGTYSSGDDGRINTIFRIPTYLDTIYLKTDYIGLESLVSLPIIGGQVSYVYGSGDGHLPGNPLINPQQGSLKSTIAYSYIGTYNASGVPDYLISPRDIISQSFLDDVNASLPERIRLPLGHPDYLAVGNEADILLKEQADVWITFVHEGAGYLNALGYYVYDQNNPPKTVKEIASYQVIFPNASYVGSGGGLTSGDKVYLGRFDAGKAIGWFLVPNGWSGGKVNGSRVFYSEPAFNPESDVTLKQHTVLLYDSKRSVLLMGFEDMDRMNGSDDDFNDAVFYVTANPVKAVDISRVPPMDTPGDRDKDGITDIFDDYPDDNTRAFDYFYPAEGQFGTFLAEDLWPGLGDFDFNDLVVDYHFNQVADPKNQIKEMNIVLKTRAIGASFRNGFGIQLQVPANVVESVIGQNIKGEYVKVNKTGVEEGQAQAVIIVYEDAYDQLRYTGSGTGVNVIPGNGWSEPSEQKIKVVFNSSQSVASLGLAPYNPFLIVDGERSKEIHLSGKKPTDLADVTYFGQGEDASEPKSGYYYRSSKNLVWLLDVPQSIDYMVEKSDLTTGYTRFAEWAESGGFAFPDWYTDQPGYRKESVLYKK